ncbi:MAG: leucyl/phenylalanyl-tRNA--protein transferase [Rhodospirillales bacterium]|nr:leucyl/phenylalanyl-tRNA--protein transferase [Rhodospirillales bacterium]
MTARGLTPELLIRAYAAGVFPMADRRDEARLRWIDPPMRGIIPLEAFHVPRRLLRTVRHGDFDVRCDTAFDTVIRACADTRPETWINDDIIRAYGALQAEDLAHSVECWRDGELVGGLYGVSLGAAFFGESMFSLETDASKVALVHLVARLIAGQFTLLDVQFVTPHLERFGAIEIPRVEYQAKLADALEREAVFQREGGGGVGAALGALRQSITQTS